MLTKRLCISTIRNAEILHFLPKRLHLQVSAVCSCIHQDLLKQIILISVNFCINDFALDRKPCDDKGTPELTNVGNGQNIAVDDSVFHPLKRSNSGHIPSADTGENGKPQLNG